MPASMHTKIPYIHLRISLTILYPKVCPWRLRAQPSRQRVRTLFAPGKLVAVAFQLEHCLWHFIAAVVVVVVVVVIVVVVVVIVVFFFLIY